MSTAALRRFVREGHALHGVQLVTAIAAAAGASAALQLPEGVWAVMSALIVTRANPDATLSAGWQRAAATLVGALVGLGGLSGSAWLPSGAQHGAALALVGLLAFATADRPSLRSAPITALIVVTAASRPGVSVLGVAVLRTLEIGVGVLAAMAVAWLAHRLNVTARPTAVVSGLLRQLAVQLHEATSKDDSSRADAERRGAAIRATVRRLGEMVHGTRQSGPQTLLRLAMRLAQDASLLGRLLEAAPVEQRAAAAATSAAAADALEATAARLAGDATSPAERLRTLAQTSGARWQADAVELLRSDLTKLLHVAAR